MPLTLSVVIPVFNGAGYLDQCLKRLASSMEKPLECIVVDDGSTDNSAAVARQYGATVLVAEAQGGPAKARNLGVRAASGDVILFLDADVLVSEETTSRILHQFRCDSELDAVMGSYDTKPSAPNFTSQYRNLMHCFVHQHASHKATTFWAGCGAMRRSVFLQFNGFDENYHSPAIEDIELGSRMAKENRKLILNPDIQVTHLKHWGIRNMLKTDFFYRALPWSELAIRSGWMPNDLNLRISQRISVALVFVLASLAAYLSVIRGAYFLVPLFATFFILLSYYWLECSAKNQRVVTGLLVGLMALIAGFAYLSHLLIIFPLVLISWIALFTRHRYAYPLSVWHRRSGVLVGGYCLLVIVFVWAYLPMHPVGTAFLIVLLTLVALNKQFYLFLAGERGRLFALAAFPFHLLYFISSGLAFLLALTRYFFSKLAAPVALPVEKPKTEAR